MTSILVVDDSKFMARTMKSGLEQLQYQVVDVGHDGLEGVEKYNAHLPDVVLMDVTMPNMDGLDCLIEIRKSHPNARVIMLSAIKDEEVIQQCYQAGAVNYLRKPLGFREPQDIERLKNAIDEAVSERIGGSNEAR